MQPVRERGKAILALLLPLVVQSAGVESILARPIDAVHKRYDAKDDKGVKLDCLVAAEAGPKRYLAVHHALIDNVFHLRLVESSNLLDWKHVRTIDPHGHQGTLVQVGRKWLVAWEKDGPNGNWIRLAGFDSTDDLVKGNVAKQFDLPRNHSKFAEGTPSILDAKIGSWDDCKVDLRFHYWRNGDVDRQAEGTVTNFKEWKSNVRSEVNGPLEATYKGNIGDRTQFRVNRTGYEVLEAQYRKNDWASWRILLSKDGDPFKELSIKTEKGSTSFANPAVTRLQLPNGRWGLFVSYFLPSQGNAATESGQLIYYREIP